MPARSTEPSALSKRLPAQTARALLAWYEVQARDLPWRRSIDPYEILVSEIMLQQTRVDAVIDRYRRFLRRFPTLSALASASEDDVLAEWSGLGYYRRARNLHALARLTMQRHGGVLPSEYAALRALPGVGDYTAAAVTSIAFDLPHLSVDGNVARVMCRLLAIADDPRRAAVKHQLHEAAEAALRVHPPSQFNQAMMELGALICLPRSPRCKSCPCSSDCGAYAAGEQESIPPPRIRTIRTVHEAAMVLVRNNDYMVLRGQRPGVLESMWEFPTVDSRLATPRDGQVAESSVPQGAVPSPRQLAARLRRHLANLQIRVDGLRPLGTIRHSITNRRIVCHVFAPEHARIATPAGQDDAAGRDCAACQIGWYSAAKLAQIPLAASARKILDMIAL